MNPARGVLGAALAVAALSCGGRVPPVAGGAGAAPADGVAPPPVITARAAATRAAGTVLYLGLELPEPGTVFGGVFSGAAFDVRQQTFQMTESVRAGWTRAARLRGEAYLHDVGFQVRAVGGPTSDVVLMEEDVRFGVQGRVGVFDVRVRTGPPSRADARVEIAWELLDVVQGTVIMGRSHSGQSRGATRLEDAVFDAFDDALGGLVADSLFLRALTAPVQLAGFAGNAAPVLIAVPGELIPVLADDLNPSRDSGAIARVSAGLATLRGTSDQVYGTAFLLTRSGLALTSLRSARSTRRLRARLPSGVIRTARIVRSHAGLDVALIQIACPDACPTVDWTVRRPGVYDQVILIGAPASDVESAPVSRGRVGGQWGLANGITLDTPAEEAVVGGEPVALAESGLVVGMVSARPGRRTALLLGELLRALGVSPPVEMLR